MRALSAGFLSLSLLCGACATSSQPTALQERREAIRQSNAEHQTEYERTYRGEEGFQSTRWGMSSQEVRQFYPKARADTPMILAVNTPVADLPARVYFFFTEDRLALVSVEFVQLQDVRAAYSELSSLLASKYGRASSLDEPASAEAHELRTVWTTPESRIELLGHRSIDGKVLDLHYASTVLGPRVQQQLETETARHRREQLKDL